MADHTRPKPWREELPILRDDGLLKLDDRLVDEALKILQGGSAKVHKTPRAGFTTSGIAAAMKINKRILCIAPTNRILEETVKEASNGEAIIIAANNFCTRIQETIGTDRLLEKLPVTLPDCKGCGEYGTCAVTRIIREKGKTIIGITYPKLEALMLSKSNLAREIKKELSKVDIVMLDEAHTIALPSIVKVKAGFEISIPERFRALNEVNHRWLTLNSKAETDLNELKSIGDSGHVGKHLSKLEENEDPINFKRVSSAFDELFELAKERTKYGISDQEILTIRNLITLLAGHHVAISYYKEENKQEGEVYFTANYWISQRALRDFLTKNVPKATHLYVSGTLIEPSPNFFSELSGKEIKDEIFIDLRNTNSRMHILPDKWRLTSKSFRERFEQIVSKIEDICRNYSGHEIYIVAPNAGKAKATRMALKEQFGERVLVDYYRSDRTMGVKSRARICIALGLAEVPSNTYDYRAEGNDDEELWLNSQRLRKDSVHAATWQTWSRVKDPEGIEESRVYCIGVRADQVRDVVTWGPGRRLELEKIEERQLPAGEIARWPVFKLRVDRPIEAPKIHIEVRTSTRRDRHAVGEYIDRTEAHDVNLINSEYVDIFPIINYRQIVHKLGIYNNCKDKFELQATAAVLTSLLAARDDYYGKQGPGWTKVRGQCITNRHIMKNHIKGQFTIGLYQISLDDKVKWICYDIDDHDGTRGEDATKSDVRKLLSVLDKYAIPYLLEASGSPNSYHVWVLLRLTKTHNAYVFSRQIISEAGIDCEVFPKQQSLTKNSKFGNLVKVPLGINRKNGVRSQFLDPTNFRPYVGLVPIPGIVCLREIEGSEESNDKNTKTRITKQNQENPIVTPKLLDHSLRPCMQGVLSAKVPLEGSAGHAMRVAIAVEAWNTGLSVEKAIELFKDQADFDMKITRSNIEDIYGRAYRPYSCDKLREQCKPFVDPYCDRCTWPNGRAAKAQ